MKFQKPRLTHLLTAAVLAASLAGCVLFAPPITAEEKPSLGRVGVASMLGTHFEMIHIGAIVFGNTLTHEDAAAWHIDDLIENSTVDILRRSGFPTAASTAFASSAGAPPLGAGGTEELDAALQLAKRQGLDTLVTYSFQREEHDPSLNAGSYGLHNRGERTCLFAKFFVTVYKVSDSSMRKTTYQVKCQPVTDIEWKPRLADYSQADQARIRAALESQIKGLIASSMSETGLGGR